MNSSLIVSAAVVGILALTMSSTAHAADIPGTAALKVKSGLNIVNRAGSNNLRDAVIETGTDPDTVQLHFAGAQRVTFGSPGTLEIIRADGSIWRYRPEMHQTVNGRQKAVHPEFKVLDKDRVSLKIKDYDASAPVVLGPIA